MYVQDSITRSVLLRDSLDQPEVFRDAPVCLQLVGRTLEEEGVIAMTEIVDAALKATRAKL